jgi:hypothetical protein
MKFQSKQVGVVMWTWELGRELPSSLSGSAWKHIIGGLDGAEVSTVNAKYTQGRVQ